MTCSKTFISNSVGRKTVFYFSYYFALTQTIWRLLSPFKRSILTTAWKVSKYGVISGPYFPVLGLNTEIYKVNLHIQFEYRQIRTRNNSVFGHFFTKLTSNWFLTLVWWLWTHKCWLGMQRFLRNVKVARNNFGPKIFGFMGRDKGFDD